MESALVRSLRAAAPTLLASTLPYALQRPGGSAARIRMGLLLTSWLVGAPALRLWHSHSGLGEVQEGGDE